MHTVRLTLQYVCLLAVMQKQRECQDTVSRLPQPNINNSTAGVACLHLCLPFPVLHAIMFPGQSSALRFS